MTAFAAAAMLVLTSSDGLPVHVNPTQVVTARAVRPNQKEQLAQGVKCVINTSDGKFISVTESCDEVRRRIEMLR